MKNIIKGKHVLLVWVITLSVYAYMLLITIPKTMKYAKGMEILDMKPLGYNLNYVSDLFHSLGIEGRSFYLNHQLPVDFIYPGLFAICGLLTFYYFIQRLNLKQGIWKWLSYLPVVAGVFDYLENLGIIQLLNSFPELSSKVVLTSSSFSIIKSGATTFYFLILLVLIGKAIIKRFKQDN